MIEITTDILSQMGVRASALWVDPLNASAAKYDINKTPQRVSGWVANLLNETGNFTRLEESFNYSPQGLLLTWPSHFNADLANRLGRTQQHPANQYAIAERAYGGRMGNGPEGSGDGYKFRGVGPLQYTGKDNTTAIAKELGVPMEEIHDYLKSPKGGCESAGAFWFRHGCNELMDEDNLTEVRHRVNGGYIGLDNVRKLYQQLIDILT